MENIILTNNKDLRLVGVKVGVLSTLRFELPLVSASATRVEVIVTSGGVHSAYTATFIDSTKRWQCDIAASQFPAVGKQSYEVAYVLDGKQFWDGKGWIEIEDATTSGIEPQPRPEPYRYAVVSVNGYGADAQGAVRIPKTVIATNSPVTTEGYIEGDIYFNSETGAMWTLCNVQGTLTWVFNYKNYYTKAETEEAIDRVAAYYITYDAAGNPFPTYASLANAQTVYSGGAVRVPTRNDYCVVLADETHDNAEYRYIYAVAEGQTTGSWQPQFPVEGVMTVDQSVTKDSQNPVSGGGIWSAIWGALSALPTGFTSLYDWVVDQLAGKVPTTRKINGAALSADVTLTGADIAVSGTDTTKISAALADKADESALPYEIKSVPIVSQLRLPASAFPVTWNAAGYHGPGSISQNDQYAITGDSSSPWYLYNSDGDSIASFDRATLAYLEPGYLVEGLFFNGNAPVVGASPVLEQVYSGTLYDRTVNKVALQAGTSAFSLTLPTQNDGRSRDFLLRIDNTATGAVDATATVVDATLVDAAGMAIASLAAPAGKATAYRLTETANGTASPSANPEFVVRGANTEQEIAGKANRASPSTAGNLAALDSQGNPTDSQIPAANVALKGNIPYSLGTPIVIDTASSETVEGETVYYGEVTLADRTQNQVFVVVALDELRVTIPAETTGKVRDFGLLVAVGLGEGTALAAPALVPIAPTGETITMMNADGEMPTLADGTTTSTGSTVLYFTEVADGTFLVKGEQIQGVA